MLLNASLSSFAAKSAMWRSYSLHKNTKGSVISMLAISSVSVTAWENKPQREGSMKRS